MKEKIPRYLFPKEDELPIPYYFSSIELTVETSKRKNITVRKKRRNRRNRRTKNRSSKL